MDMFRMVDAAKVQVRRPSCTTQQHQVDALRLGSERTKTTIMVIEDNFV